MIPSHPPSRPAAPAAHRSGPGRARPVSPWLAPLLAVLLGLTTLLWWWPNRPQDVASPAGTPMMEARFNSVSFAPYRAWESPLTETFPTAAEAEADIALVAGRVRAIRTYAAIEGEYDIAAMAERHGLKLWQGIWLGSDRARNAKEVERGIAAANAHPDTVERVVVGNEVLLRRDLPVGELVADIDAVKARVKQPVTYADVWEFWQQFPEVARHVDIVTIHILPYWEDDPTAIPGAMAHVRDVYHRMQALFPGKTIAIGETGWPSRGRWRRDAAPSVVGQATFLRQFIALSREEGFDYNLIEAFDQIWKYRSEGTVGANWGLWTAGRLPKFPLSGGVVEDPAWPRHAGLTAGLALLLLGVALLGRQGIAATRLDARGQAGLAALAVALGGALAFAQAGTEPDLYDAHLRLAACVNLGGQALLAALLMLRVAALLAGERLPPSRTGADATRTVQGVLRLRPRLPGPMGLLDDLSFLFVWTAAVEALLLVFDPRYRDFPLPQFAVPLVAVAARLLARDLPRSGGAREELWAGGTLAVCAVAGAVQEGPLNLPALGWSLAALVLAAPPLLRLRPFAAADVLTPALPSESSNSA